MTCNETLRLGHSLSLLRPTFHNGPGLRVGLWVQGCSLRCTERCLNPHLLASKGGYEFAVDRVSDAVLEVAQSSFRAVEGVTVLGGEPTDQAAPLATCLSRLRRAGLSAMLYSGFTLGALRGRADPGIERLLGEVDLLVDGPFIADLYDEGLAWRGSANQVIHCLSSRYDNDSLEAAFAVQRKAFSIDLNPEGRISVSGLQEFAGARSVEASVTAWNGKARG